MIRSYSAEFVYFSLRQAWACLFAALMLLGLILTRDSSLLPAISRSDLLFLYAIGIQGLLIVCRMEHRREIGMIVVFHILATLMEWFKTSPAIGSWHYPADGSIFRVLGVPLYAGFLYSAVGSYIARAWRLLDFRFTNYPPVMATLVLAAIAYLNFFTHHFIYDMRWILIAASLVLFGRCQVHFRTGRQHRRMPIVLGFFLVAFVIWIAENIGTYAKAWAYPNQETNWELVHWGKCTAWYLLMMLSFVLVSLINRKSLRS